MKYVHIQACVCISLSLSLSLSLFIYIYSYIYISLSLYIYIYIDTYIYIYIYTSQGQISFTRQGSRRQGSPLPTCRCFAIIQMASILNNVITISIILSVIIACDNIIQY